MNFIRKLLFIALCLIYAHSSISLSYSEELGSLCSEFEQESSEEEVCGSDSNTYQSQCDCWREGIEVESIGPCAQEIGIKKVYWIPLRSYSSPIVLRNGFYWY